MTHDHHTVSRRRFVQATAASSLALAGIGLGRTGFAQTLTLIGETMPNGTAGPGNTLDEAEIDHARGHRAHGLVRLERQLSQQVQRRFRMIMQVPQHIPLRQRQPQLQQPPVRLPMMTPLQTLHSLPNLLQRWLHTPSLCRLSTC